MRRFLDIAYTPTVLASQERYGVRSKAAKMAAGAAEAPQLGPAEAAFIAARDHFYLASVAEGGWPYVQFRGGPVGFLKVLDAETLGYADFRGNLQYLTVGNLQHDKRVALILLDQAHRRRLKILARVEVYDQEQRPELCEQLEDPHYRARIERAMVLRVEAFDWNCPRHITPRYSLEELGALEGAARERALEALAGSGKVS